MNLRHCIIVQERRRHNRSPALYVEVKIVSIDTVEISNCEYIDGVDIKDLRTRHLNISTLQTENRLKN